MTVVPPTFRSFVQTASQAVVALGLAVVEAPQAEARGTIPVLQQVTRNTTGDVSAPKLRSQDGSRVAFTSTGDVMGPGTQTAEPELYLYDLGTGTMTRATTTPGHGAWDAARPTDQIFAGERPEVVAFVSTADLDPNVGNADHNPEIFLWEVVTGAFRQLTDTLPPVVNREPYPSDSAKCIVFTSNGDLDNNDGSDAANNPGTGYRNPDGSFEVFQYSRLTDEGFPGSGNFTQVSNAPSAAYESSDPVVGGYWFGRQCQTTAYVSNYDQLGLGRTGRKIFEYDRNSGSTLDLVAPKEIPWGIVEGGDYLHPAISSASQFARGPFVVFQTDADLWKNGSSGFEMFRYRVFHPRMTQYTDILVGDVERPVISDGGGIIAFQSTGEILDVTREARPGGPPPFNADGNSEIFRLDGRRRVTQVTSTEGCDNTLPSLRDDGTTIAFRSTCDFMGFNPGGLPQVYLYRMVDRDDPLSREEFCLWEDACCNEANGCYTRIEGEKPKPRRRNCDGKPPTGACAPPPA